MGGKLNTDQPLLFGGVGVEGAEGKFQDGGVVKKEYRVSALTSGVDAGFVTLLSFRGGVWARWWHGWGGWSMAVG